MTRPALRLRWHRGTTAHTSSLYPFATGRGWAHRGVFVGLDTLSGGGEFCWDPFAAYAAGLVTNPNCWVFGVPGRGKSALVKTLIWRMFGIWRAGAPDGRWVAIADPKGEYRPLAERLGLTILRLAPGGTTRLNPLAPGDGPPDPDDVSRRVELVTTLVAAVLDRKLGPAEDAVVFAAIEDALAAGGDEPTLAHVAVRLAEPSAELAARVQLSRHETAAVARPVGFALDKLLTRDLRGMFDGPSTGSVTTDGPGLVVDLSAVYANREALPLVMVAAAAWLREVLATPGPRRVQVLDEAWALLGHPHTAAYLQACFKLGRTYGVANIGVAHRPTDLGAQADDGTAVAKTATGLLSDSATKVILAQDAGELATARAAFGLTDPEVDAVSHLLRGRALWKVGERTAVVQHLLNEVEARQLVDTDDRMRGLAELPATG